MFCLHAEKTSHADTCIEIRRGIKSSPCFFVMPDVSVSGGSSVSGGFVSDGSVSGGSVSELAVVF